MRWLYNILFLLFFLFASPYYFFRLCRRGCWRKGFRQRLGDFDKDVQQSLTNRHVVWVHAARVGQTNVCVALVNALHERMPNAKILVSTTAVAAMAQLRERLPARVGKIYYPIDLDKYVFLALHAIHPNAVILIESGIWPNFIWRARASHIPLFLVDTRLSNRSYRRYKRFGFLFRDLFGAFCEVGAQTETCAAALRQVGCRPEAVHVLGDLRFDAAQANPVSGPDARELLARLGAGDDALVWVAGGTYPGEERILAAQFLRLRRRFPNLLLVLVPRHVERARAIGRDLGNRGLKLVFRTEIASATALPPGSPECLLVDAPGEFMSFCSCAAVVFLGKSLAAHGGQNPIEPAALGKAIVFGPNMEDFSDAGRLLVGGGGATQVRDAAELERAMEALLADAGRREQLGAAARRIVKENQGALARTVEMIAARLAERGVYVAPLPGNAQD
jgi:3-deoxy-D-manno-octulosonic-acid transferase